MRQQSNMIFLLGSGASIAAGVNASTKPPNTKEITDRIVSAEDVVFHGGDRFIIDSALAKRSAEIPMSDQWVDRVKYFSNRLKSIIDPFINDREGRDANYEDVYYVLDQLYNDVTNQFNDPTIQPFIQGLNRLANDILEEFPDPTIDHDVKDLAGKTIDYIEDIVAALLWPVPDNLEGFGFIRDAANDGTNNRIDVFSLNHDRCLESYLKKESIPYADGFGKPKNGIRYWLPDVYGDQSRKVRIFKLHGSVDWCRLIEFNPSKNYIGILSVPDRLNLTNPNGKSLVVWPRPVFLVGSINKYREYIHGTYLDLHSHFRPSAFGANAIIIYGYGFGDEGINRRIFEWLGLEPNNRLIVIDVDEDIAKKDIRLERNHGNIVFIYPSENKPVEWEEIKNILVG